MPDRLTVTPSESGKSEHGLNVAAPAGSTTAVLHTGGLQFASEKAVLEKALEARPGVVSVEANPVAQTATVRYDPGRTNVAELRKWVEECGYHCAGKSPMKLWRRASGDRLNIAWRAASVLSHARATRMEREGRG